MSSKKNQKKDVIVSSIIEKEKKDNKNLVIYFLLFIILILGSILIYHLYLKEKEKKCPICSAVTIKEIEVEPKHQIINYQGFRFRMPLDWDFVTKDNKYEIINKESNLLIFMDNLEIDYSIFSSEEYQKRFVELYQTSTNVKIEKSNLRNDNGLSYYLFEGTMDSYDYIGIAVGNENKVILINAQFADKVSYDKLYQSVIDFALSIVK